MVKRITIFLILISLITLVFSGCFNSKLEVPPVPKKEKTKRISLFCPASDGLIGEDYETPISKSDPESTLKRLIQKKGEVYTDQFAPFLPPGTKILSLKVDKKGLATVNFNKNVLYVKPSKKEIQTYAVAAIVKTLTQFKNIKSVKFQIYGREKGKIKTKIGERNIEDWWGKITLKEQPWK